MAPPDVLVTGSSGHLGYALMLSLPSYGFTPIGVDILPSTNDNGTVSLAGSIADRPFVAGLFSKYPTIRYVLHTATLHKPHVGSHTKSQFIDTNVHGTLNLLEEAAATGKTEAFIFTSTTSTFGKALAPKPGHGAAWIDETVVPIPKNIYGTTKVAAEDLCQLVQAETKMPTLVLKTSRFFPEEDDNDTSREQFGDENLKVCELLYRRADIADVVSAHVCAMKEARRIGWAKYIISAPPPFGRNEATLKMLDGQAVEALRNVRPEQVEFLLNHGWKLLDRLDRVYDSSKAISELSWKPVYTFDYAVERIEMKEDWRSPLTGQVGKRGYHAVPTGVYTT